VLTRHCGRPRDRRREIADAGHRSSSAKLERQALRVGRRQAVGNAAEPVAVEVDRRRTVGSPCGRAAGNDGDEKADGTDECGAHGSSASSNADCPRSLPGTRADPVWSPRVLCQKENGAIFDRRGEPSARPRHAARRRSGHRGHAGERRHRRCRTPATRPRWRSTGSQATPAPEATANPVFGADP